MLNMSGIYRSLPLLLILLFSFNTAEIHAQDIQDPDVLFNQARDAAFVDEDYPKAIELGNQALVLAPDYLDVKEFVGRVYFWNGQKTRSAAMLEEVLKADPKRELSRATLADIYIEEAKYTKTISLMDDGLEYSPSNTTFLFKKGYAQELSGRPNEAIRSYRAVQNIEPTYPGLQNRIDEMDINHLNWVANVTGTYTFFDNGLDPWTIGRAELVRKTQLGSFGIAANFGSRFDLTDQELELNGYPVLTNKMYGYFSLGISSNEFFPKYRVSASVFRSFPKRIEGSVGFRRLSFNALDVNMLTASVTKFYSFYRFSGRGFLAFTENSTSYTAILSGRRFFRNTDNFIEVRAGYGNAAIEYNVATDVNNLSSYELSLFGQKSLSEQLLLQGEFGFYNEEVTPDNVRKRYQILLGLSYKF